MYALWVHARDINNQAQADAVIARARSAGITDILFQVLDDSGRAHYSTSLFTRCPDIGSFDPLRYLAASGIRAHAWLCVGTDILSAHPEWNAVTTQRLASTFPRWADFTMPAVRVFAADWCASIVQAYPSVGIHLDYLRWHTGYGDARLSFATGAPITQAMQQIAAAVPDTATLSAAVSSNPLGNTSGSWQVWGDWMGLLDYAVIMAYPANVADLATQMARSSGYSKNQIAVGLSGLFFQYNPYRETRLTPAALTGMAAWARDAGYKNFAWFDYTKIDPEQYVVIKQFAPEEVNIMAIVQDLTAMAAELRAQAGRLRSEATAIEAQADKLTAIAGSLTPLDALAAEVAQKSQQLSEGL